VELLHNVEVALSSGFLAVLQGEQLVKQHGGGLEIETSTAHPGIAALVTGQLAYFQ